MDMWGKINNLCCCVSVKCAAPSGSPIVYSHNLVQAICPIKDPIMTLFNTISRSIISSQDKCYKYKYPVSGGKLP